MKPLYIQLPGKVDEKLRVLCAKNGLSLKGFVTAAIVKRIDDFEKKEQAEK